MLSRWLLFGRRRGGRRDGERDFVYVDRPGLWTLAGFVVVVGLSSLDAFYTLELLEQGKAEEANPIMRAALHLGVPHFIFIKTILTIVAVGFLCLHKNWPLGRACLAIAIVGYSVLIVYHLLVQRQAAKLLPQAVNTAPFEPTRPPDGG